MYVITLHYNIYTFASVPRRMQGGVVKHQQTLDEIVVQNIPGYDIRV